VIESEQFRWLKSRAGLTLMDNVGTSVDISNHKLKWGRGNPTAHGVVFRSRGYVCCHVQPGGV